MLRKSSYRSANITIFFGFATLKWYSKGRNKIYKRCQYVMLRLFKGRMHISVLLNYIM
jgi:hypothetical protein